MLAVIKVKDLDEAFDVANDSVYALTGGIYSRSPANSRARHELQAGNVYLNRGITGAWSSASRSAASSSQASALRRAAQITCCNS